MEGKEITSSEYLKSLDEWHTVFDMMEDYEYSERQLIEFSDEFAKVKVSQLQLELKKAKELIEEARKEITEYKTKHGILGHLGRIQDKLSTFLEGSGNKTK